MASERTIGRLSQYRRLLQALLAEGAESIFSHDLAAQAGVTAAQVRRDVMAIGYTGSPTKGYDVRALIASISDFLDGRATVGVALVGVGNLGRALLAYFVGRHPRLAIRAAFDVDPGKNGRVIHGCKCFAMEELDPVVRAMDIRLGIITVPADQAQRTATLLCQAGIRGILNFAPVRVWAPSNVYVEHIDVTMGLEKVAYFARQLDAEKEAVR